MSTRKTRTNAHTNSRAPWFGAATAFALFLLTGLIPSLVYGGYAGLMVASVFYGPGGATELGARLLTGGGMVLGCFAVLSLYLVVGALLGKLVGAVLRRLEPVVKPTAVEDEHTVR